jgi:hypothetical protein
MCFVLSVLVTDDHGIDSVWPSILVSELLVLTECHYMFAPFDGTFSDLVTTMCQGYESSTFFFFGVLHILSLASATFPTSHAFCTLSNSYWQETYIYMIHFPCSSMQHAQLFLCSVQITDTFIYLWRPPPFHPLPYRNCRKTNKVMGAIGGQWLNQ